MAEQPASEEMKNLTLRLGLLLRGSQIRAGACVNREIIRFCWQAGEDLAALPGDIKARKQALTHISGELAPHSIQKNLLSPEGLEELALFRRCWPDSGFVYATLCELPWEQQRLLLAVRDPQRRKELALQAIRGGWLAEQLSRAIQAG